MSSMSSKLSSFVNSYLETALWATTGFDSENLDDEFSVEDIPDTFVEISKNELDEFFRKSSHLFTEEELQDMSRIAHDFWLTRNRHGAGFWDGDYKNGEAITEICLIFGENDDKLRDCLVN